MSYHNDNLTRKQRAEFIENQQKALENRRKEGIKLYKEPLYAREKRELFGKALENSKFMTVKEVEDILKPLL